MIVWINGTAGVGKTAVARELVRMVPGSMLFEPEVLGPPLRRLLSHSAPPRASAAHNGTVRSSGRAPNRLVDSPAWRKLVADTAAALLNEVPGPLVIPMELLWWQHRDEIFGRFAGYGLAVHHVFLDVDETILSGGSSSRQVDDMSHGDVLSHRGGPSGERRRDTAWRGAALDGYQSAVPSVRADACPIEAGSGRPRAAAEEIVHAVSTGRARRDIVRSPTREGDTVAAGVLFFDTGDRVLLVDPTYKPGWEFPGGVVESGEPPSLAAAREVSEELGFRIDRDRLRLLLVDWEDAPPSRYGGLRLLFDGGRLTATRTAQLSLPTEELRGWRFVTENEAGALLPPERSRRLCAALRARAAGTVAHLESGEPGPALR